MLTTSITRPPADEVAWLFNLRGGDVAYNPVFVRFLKSKTCSLSALLDGCIWASCCVWLRRC